VVLAELVLCLGGDFPAALAVVSNAQRVPGVDLTRGSVVLIRQRIALGVPVEAYLGQFSP
jgi:hypothetical protein